MAKIYGMVKDRKRQKQVSIINWDPLPVPINSSLRNLILEIKKDRDIPKSEYVLPRIKEWENGDQAVSLKIFLKSLNFKPVKFHALRACFATQMLSNGVSAPIVMKIGWWKNTSTMDIYLRLAGVDTKGSTECLGCS